MSGTQEEGWIFIFRRFRHPASFLWLIRDMIHTMTDLPDPTTVGNTPPPSLPVSVTPGIGKEREVGGVSFELPIRDVAHAEVELPKEVVSVGVKVQQVHVPVP